MSFVPGVLVFARKYCFVPGMEPVSEALAHSEVLDGEGRAHRLEGYWADRPAVLVFLRHFA